MYIFMAILIREIIRKYSVDKPNQILIKSNDVLLKYTNE